MNSVLLIGSEYFTASITTQVRGLDALTAIAVTSVLEAIELMGEAMPDVVLVQASELVEGSVLKTFSQERQSIYFIVLDEPGRFFREEQRNGHGAYSGESKLKTLPDNILDGLSELYIEKKVEALETGADAYIWLMPASPDKGLDKASKDEVAADPWLKHEAFASGCKVASQTIIPIRFRQSQQRLIQAYIQIGLNRAQRYRDLSRINDWLSAVALVDALTQLSNRRAFDLELPRQIKVARAKGLPLSLMMLDIDFFKSVNDRYGHLVGDDVLKMLAKRLLANMRFYDTPFRYGGEEFVITLNNTDLKEGIAIAQRLRQSIDQTPFNLGPAVDTPSQLPLTVSIGLTELCDEDDPKGRSLLHRADQYLLQAKTSGRNQVVSDLDQG